MWCLPGVAELWILPAQSSMASGWRSSKLGSNNIWRALVASTELADIPFSLPALLHHIFVQRGAETSSSNPVAVTQPNAQPSWFSSSLILPELGIVCYQMHVFQHRNHRAYKRGLCTSLSVLFVLFCLRVQNKFPKQSEYFFSLEVMFYVTDGAYYFWGGMPDKGDEFLFWMTKALSRDWVGKEGEEENTRKGWTIADASV